MFLIERTIRCFSNFFGLIRANFLPCWLVRRTCCLVLSGQFYISSLNGSVPLLFRLCAKLHCHFQRSWNTRRLTWFFCRMVASTRVTYPTDSRFLVRIYVIVTIKSGFSGKSNNRSKLRDLSDIRSTRIIGERTNVNRPKNSLSLNFTRVKSRDLQSDTSEDLRRLANNRAPVWRFHVSSFFLSSYHSILITCTWKPAIARITKRDFRWQSRYHWCEMITTDRRAIEVRQREREKSLSRDGSSLWSRKNWQRPPLTGIRRTHYSTTTTSSSP